MENMYYSSEVMEQAGKNISMVTEGKIRLHILGNSADIHTGEMEQKECSSFCDFIKTKNGDLVDNLVGCEMYEEY